MRPNEEEVWGPLEKSIKVLVTDRGRLEALVEYRKETGRLNLEPPVQLDLLIPFWDINVALL
jgi:hypothetical protein